MKSSETLDMTSEGLGEMFEGPFADACGDFLLLVLLGDERIRQARTPVDASRIICLSHF